MGIKAVIFDLDGTLVDSIEGLAYSMNNVLKTHGFFMHSTEVYKTLVGNGVKELVRRALPAHVAGSGDVDRYLSEMRGEYRRHWGYKMAVYDGIHELLRCLEEKGIGFAVDTNKDEDVSKQIIERFFPGFGFACVMGSKPGFPHKPDPFRAKLIAAKLGIQPEQCVYLGDSEVDVMTAKNAGMVSASAAWGFRKVEDLVSAHAEHIINKPMELIKFIEYHE